MRLLYVEDNRINALLFEEMLLRHPGLELRIVETGAEALELAARWHPEVLVLDAHLPDTTGHELLPRLRSITGLGPVPAFMCSADSQPEDLQRARDIGFVGYWTKPIDVARVLADLESLAARPAP
jgi:CheY-like chemotaxis protein